MSNQRLVFNGVHHGIGRHKMLPVDKHENSVVYVRRNEIYKEHALDEDETTELRSDGHNSSQFQEKDMCLESEYS